MISPELLRRHRFFAGFSHEQLDELAMAADDASISTNHWIFLEGEILTQFFLLLEGSVTLTQNIPDRKARQTTAMHVTGNLTTRVVNIGTLTEQEILGWSALIPPNKSTAGAQAMTECRVISFDMVRLRRILEQNCSFSHLMTLKAAQIIRERLRMRRIELLGDYVQGA
jgi:CRP-like cAMP-binding protein